MKRGLECDKSEAALASPVEENEPCEVSLEAHAKLEEMLKKLRFKRAKLSADFVKANSLVKDKISTRNSELSKQQTNTTKEMAMLRTLLTDEKNSKHHSNPEFKHALIQIFLLLRSKFKMLLAIQEKRDTEAADLKNQVVEILNDAITQVTRKKDGPQEQFAQMTELLMDKSNERHKTTTTFPESSKQHAEVKNSLMKELECNKKENDELKGQLEESRKSFVLLRGEFEKERTDNYKKRIHHIKIAQASGRASGRESAKQTYLDKIATILKNHESELSELQQKLDDMLAKQQVEFEAKILKKVAKHDKEIEEWKLRLEMNIQQSISYREDLEKTHSEEISGLRAIVNDRSHELVLLREDATNWKVAHDRLSKDHDTLKDTHARQFSELENTKEFKSKIVSLEHELEQRRSTEKETTSDWQKQLKQAEDEIENYKELLSEEKKSSEVQLDAAKDEVWRCTWLLSQETMAKQEMQKHHNQVLEQKDAQHIAEIAGLKRTIAASTTEANNVKMNFQVLETAARNNNAYNAGIIYGLEQEMQLEKSKFGEVTTKMNNLLSSKDVIQQELDNKLAEITAVRVERTQLLDENLSITKEIETLKAKVRLHLEKQEGYIKATEKIQELESQHQLVVARLQNDLDSAQNKYQGMLDKLEADKAALENQIEKLEKQLKQQEQLQLTDKAKCDADYKLALETTKKKFEAQVSECHDQIARLCLEQDTLIQQEVHNRIKEASAAQTSSSDVVLPGNTIVSVILPHEKGQSEEDANEQVLQGILRECEELEKSISIENIELRAGEDEHRRLDAEHMNLVKQYGDGFLWKPGKQK